MAARHWCHEHLPHSAALTQPSWESSLPCAVWLLQCEHCSDPVYSLMSKESTAFESSWFSLQRKCRKTTGSHQKGEKAAQKGRNAKIAACPITYGEGDHTELLESPKLQTVAVTSMQLPRGLILCMPNYVIEEENMQVNCSWLNWKLVRKS